MKCGGGHVFGVSMCIVLWHTCCPVGVLLLCTINILVVKIPVQNELCAAAAAAAHMSVQLYMMFNSVLLQHS